MKAMGDGQAQIGSAGNMDLRDARAGLRQEDGSFKYFKWDTARGCMVEFELSTPFRQRLARSFDAFLRSWRLG